MTRIDANDSATPAADATEQELPSWLQSDNPEDAEALFETIEKLWRDYYAEKGPLSRVKQGEKPAEVLEVSLFAFGLMASIMRTIRAQIILVRSGYTVESRAIFRSTLDQAMALTELERSRVYAVHAYGRAHAENLRRLRGSSARGFALGDVNEEYIERFLDLAANQKPSREVDRAQNAIKTGTVGGEGKFEALLYQAWLEATPLSKPSMRLSDAYTQAEVTSSGVRMHAFLDSDPDSVADPRLVLATVLPRVFETYARIMRDDELLAQIWALDPTR